MFHIISGLNEFSNSTSITIKYWSFIYLMHSLQQEIERLCHEREYNRQQLENEIWAKDSAIKRLVKVFNNTKIDYSSYSHTVNAFQL